MAAAVPDDTDDTDDRYGTDADDLALQLVELLGTLTDLVTTTAQANATHLAAVTGELRALGAAVEGLGREVELVKRSTRRDVSPRATLSAPDLDALATAVVTKLQASFRVVAPGPR